MLRENCFYRKNIEAGKKPKNKKKKKRKKKKKIEKLFAT